MLIYNITIYHPSHHTTGGSLLDPRMNESSALCDYNLLRNAWSILLSWQLNAVLSLHFISASFFPRFLHTPFCNMFISVLHLHNSFLSYIVLSVVRSIHLIQHKTLRLCYTSALFQSFLLRLPSLMFLYSFYDRLVFNSSLIHVAPPSSSHPTSISLSLIPVFQFWKCPRGRPYTTALPHSRWCVCVCAAPVEDLQQQIYSPQEPRVHI